MDDNLLTKKCEPCEGGVEPFKEPEIKTYLSYLKTPWEVPPTHSGGKASEGQAKSISKEFQFKDFKEAMIFVNKVADIAESEGHHPDIKISYNKVKILLTTHSIKGLSVNDFILARKIEELL